ncbi:MAG: hypothetical protein HYU36_17040 [Planctomycetes bacterium]|nr:hypothetical protein [Planctomycetota bacterium]
MSQENFSLETVRVASPCRVSWGTMIGDDRTRYCGRCRMNVYNISSMTREEAETFIREREGRTCVRFYQRTDGTILTSDCGGIGEAVRKRWPVAAGLVAAVIALLVGGIAFAFTRRNSPAGPLPILQNPIAENVEVTMGAMCVEPPAVEQTPIEDVAVP